MDRSAGPGVCTGAGSGAGAGNGAVNAERGSSGQRGGERGRGVVGWGGVGWVFEKRSNGVASGGWALRENLYGIPGI